MEDQSFQLLMSKLESIEEGQTRMYLHFNDRLDRQDDKIDAVGKEVNFAKGVAYVVGLGTAGTAWVNSWFK